MGWPSCAASGSSTMRPTMSTVEPAVNGMTALIGRDGQACARAKRGNAGVASAAAESFAKQRRVIIKILPIFCRVFARAASLARMTLAGYAWQPTENAANAPSGSFSGILLMTRRITDPRAAAEAAFKTATAKPPPEPAPKPPLAPRRKGAGLAAPRPRCTGSFSGGRSGWQDRINAALRKAAGL